MLKVFAVQVFVVLIATVFFVPFYMGEADSYARVMREALGDIGLSLTVPSLRAFFDVRLVFRGISWPSELPLRQQITFAVSLFQFTNEYTQAASRIVYYKLLHGKWASPLKPLPTRIKEMVSKVLEWTVLPAAPVYAQMHDGTGTRDEDMKAWAEENPDATKLDLTGLTSLTFEGVCKLFTMCDLDTFNLGEIWGSIKGKNFSTAEGRLILAGGPVARRQGVAELIRDGGANNSKAVAAVAAMLRDSRITTLNLQYFFIEDEGEKAIAAALRDSRVTSLDLGCSDISNEGAKAIAAALQDSRVTRLNLENCYSIGDEGAKGLTRKNQRRGQGRSTQRREGGKRRPADVF